MKPACNSQPLRRPLIGLVLVFIAGTWGAVMIGGLPPAGMGAASACLLIISLAGHGRIFLFQRRKPPVASVFDSTFSVFPRLISGLATLCLYLAVGAFAWFTAGMRLDDPSPRALPALMEKPREGVEVEGIVADDPVARPSWKGDREVWSFAFRLDSIHRLIPWQQARGTVRVILPSPPEGRRPQYGDRWRMAGVLIDNARFPDPAPDDETVSALESENASRGATHWRNIFRPAPDWLNRRYTFRADPDAVVFLGEHQGFLPLETCLKLRRQCAGLLALGIDHRPEVVGLLQALLLGYRQELPEKLRNDFTVTGTYHIFAISGQHVAIISLFIIVVLQSYRVSRVKWFLVLAPILVMFTVSTGMSSSAVRGCLMALLCFLGPLVGRKPDVPSALALAALIILAVDPFQLFNYGFLLSFIAVSGLIILCPPLIRQLAPSIEPDPLRLQPQPTLVCWGRRAIWAVVFLFVTSLAAWLVTTPLVARWFNLVSPIALLANLVVIPVATLVLLAGCLSILVGGAFPLLGEIFNFANLALVSCLLWLTDLMARVPYGHCFVRSPPVWSLAVWFATLAIWVVWRRRVWIWMLGPVFLALALVIGAWGSRHSVELDVMNMGDGPVFFVNTPGGDDLLIDPGSRYLARQLIRQLRRQGVDKLKAVVLTGADSARAGGARDILRAIPVDALWIPHAAVRSASGVSRPGTQHEAWRAGALREAGTAAREKRTEIHVLTNKTMFSLPGGTTWTVLCPALNGSATSESEPGAAWLLRRGPVSVLFAENQGSQIAIVVSAEGHDVKPSVLIENRMGSDPDLNRDNLNHGTGRRGALDSEWRVICTRSLITEEPSGSAGSSRVLRLAPGEGARIHLEDRAVRLEPLVLE